MSNKFYFNTILIWNWCKIFNIKNKICTKRENVYVLFTTFTIFYTLNLLQNFVIKTKNISTFFYKYILYSIFDVSCMHHLHYCKRTWYNNKDVQKFEIFYKWLVKSSKTELCREIKIQYIFHYSMSCKIICNTG